jgi:predicted GNAT family acetyltransferase
VLADIDRRGLKIVPLCSYARAHVADRPHLQAMVARGD